MSDTLPTPTPPTPVPVESKPVESPSIDVEKLVADRVSQAMSQRDAAETDVRRRAQLRASVIESHLNGKHDLADYLPDTDNLHVLHEAAAKIRKSFLRHLPDFGGVHRDGGTPAHQTVADLSSVPAHELIRQNIHKLTGRLQN